MAHWFCIRSAAGEDALKCAVETWSQVCPRRLRYRRWRSARRLAPSVQVIIDTVRDALDEIPPEIVSDLMDIGICLAGGGALLQGLADRLTEELKLRVWVAEDPLDMRCPWRGRSLRGL